MDKKKMKLFDLSKKFLVCSLLFVTVAIESGCSGNSVYFPFKPEYRAIFFTDEKVDPDKAELIEVSAAKQDVELTVKNADISPLPFKHFYVSEWDSNRQEWEVTATSFPDQNYGDFFRVYKVDKDVWPAFVVKLAANETGKPRRLMLEVDFDDDECVPYGLVEIVQMPDMITE